MMLADVLRQMGFVDGWAADESKGILIWLHDEPQPTEDELIAAGWIKPAPVEEAQPSIDVG